jgi:hypothetical protein
MWIQSLLSLLELFLKLLGSLPDLDLHSLLSRSQTPEHLLADHSSAGVVIDFIEERCVELPLHFQRGQDLPHLSSDGPFILSSFPWKQSLLGHDPTSLIRW